MQLPQAFLLDSSIYLFRGWHLYAKDLLNSDQQPVGALHAFADILAYLIERKPDYLICAFDGKKDNCWRREIDSNYKAHRPPTPAALYAQFKMAQQLSKLAGIPGFISNRYEADDIIGTFGTVFQRQQISSAVITRDKDLAQIIKAGDIWWDITEKVKLTEKGVAKQWGVPPAQIADLLALCGDKADNIEGVPGVGLKTAAQLLRRFQSLDDLLANIDNVALMRIRGAVRVKNMLKMHSDKVNHARQLTILRHDPKLPQQAAKLCPQNADFKALDEYMQYSNFPKLKRMRWQRILKKWQDS